MGMHCADVPDLRSFAPADAGCFSLCVQLFVAPVDQDASESVEIEILTPAYIQRLLENEPDEARLALGRGRVFVLRYDYPTIERHLRGLVSACEGDTWNDVARQLEKIGRWEFEDYTDERAP